MSVCAFKISETNVVYENFHKNKKQFDFSVHTENKKVIGKMKNEK